MPLDTVSATRGKTGARPGGSRAGTRQLFAGQAAAAPVPATATAAAPVTASSPRQADDGADGGNGHLGAVLFAGESAAPSGRSYVTAETLAKKQREISISEFFTKNRHLLGFDNPKKALLTSVKEAVDNALDACEEARVLPEVVVTIAQKAENRFALAVEDNGPGIVKGQMGRVFGQLLYGSKFHSLKMSRGQQGIGISAAVMYAQLTTGKPAVVISKTGAGRPAQCMKIAVDTRKNRPEVTESHEREWPERDHGTRIELEMDGRYQEGKGSVLEYLKMTAVVNPHATIIFRSPKGETHRFDRAVNELPPESPEIKPHPRGIELGMLIAMLRNTQSSTLQGFLTSDFSRVSAPVAKEICALAGVEPRDKPARLSREQAEAVFKAFDRVKIMNPRTDCVTPIGGAQLTAGLKKEFPAQFYASNTREPAVYRGNPFRIEVALAWGVESMTAPEAAPAPDPDADAPPRRKKKEEEREAALMQVLRFANRVPLQHQQSACAIFKAVMEVHWRDYLLSQSKGALPQAPVVLMVHMASVWVPFTSESKEAIAGYDVILKEIKLALQEVARQMAAFLRRKQSAADQANRRRLFDRYIPEIAAAASSITGIDRGAVQSRLQAIADRKTRQDEIAGLLPADAPSEPPADPPTDPGTPPASRKATKKAGQPSNGDVNPTEFDEGN
ncbi:MAG: DNA topoisomerase VI subunit B [Planctomycetes bacterium]|nr:DNA topoisomerase VI subunit B [Planctomycetota bacterium]